MLLKIDNLSVRFQRYQGAFSRDELTGVDGVSLSISAGEVVALFGESGGGKSLLAHAIMGLLPANATMSGTIRFDGIALDQKAYTRLRGREIGFVPQALSALDPLMRIDAQVRLAARRAGLAPAAARKAATACLATSGLSAAASASLPHRLSVGMARRALFAIGAVGGARLVVADEPTACLDGLSRDLAMKRLRAHAEGGRAVLIISHDIAAAAAIADRIVILRAGRVIETLEAWRLREHKLAGAHEYTRALLAALPENGFRTPTLSPAAREHA